MKTIENRLCELASELLHVVADIKANGDALNSAYEQGYEAGKAERQTGQWMPMNTNPHSWKFYCSECHRTAYDPQPGNISDKRCRYAYCPNCGAKMEVEHETD